LIEESKAISYKTNLNKLLLAKRINLNKHERTVNSLAHKTDSN